MNKLVLLRHGESIWNLENKFTGWIDVKLSENGINEAKSSGKILKIKKYKFDVAYTSFLVRAQDTLKYCIKELNQMDIPIIKDWRLNERHYGSLQGLNKIEIAKKFGSKQVLIWRRSYNTPPPKLSKSKKTHPVNDPKYKDIKKNLLPSSESLSDVVKRMDSFLQKEIFKDIKLGKRVLVVAHGNSLRAIYMNLNKFSEKQIMEYNIPTGVPLVIKLNKELEPKGDYFLGDQEVINEKIKQTANQAYFKK